MPRKASIAALGQQVDPKCWQGLCSAGRNPYAGERLTHYALLCKGRESAAPPVLFGLRMGVRAVSLYKVGEQRRYKEKDGDV